jgi:hypothetical protein
MAIKGAPRHEWMNWEQAILREHYPSKTTREEICLMLPRHTWESIKTHAQAVLKLKRPVDFWNGGKRQTKGWDKIKPLIESEMLTRSQIAERLGCDKANVAECLVLHRSEWYVADWIRPIGKNGKQTALIRLGDLPDIPYIRKQSTRKERAQRAINPFAAALGAITPVHIDAPRRVYKQSMEVDEWGAVDKEAA